jgi:hypothetical protein
LVRLFQQLQRPGFVHGEVLLGLGMYSLYFNRTGRWLQNVFDQPTAPGREAPALALRASLATAPGFWLMNAYWRTS